MSYMDPRMRYIMENYDNNALNLDDTFAFKCRACGKCCKNREDVSAEISGMAEQFNGGLPDGK